MNRSVLWICHLAAGVALVTLPAHILNGQSWTTCGSSICTGSNVGIGTTTPSAALEVNPGIATSNESNARLTISSWIVDGNNYIESGNADFSASTSLAITGAYATSMPVLYLNALNTNVGGNMTVNGSVGIGTGTTTLDSRFQVSGLFHVKSSLQSVYIGTSADQTDTNGANTLVGFNAGGANTSGYFNTALGVNALSTNTTGLTNTAVGTATLTHSTTASDNTALGHEAMYQSTTGASNVAVGSSALWNNTTGSGNVALGFLTLSQSTTGSGNSAVGYAAGQNTTGQDNVFAGYHAAVSNTIGGSNVIIGSNAGYSMAAGVAGAGANNNTYIGKSSGFNATGSGNVFLGYNAGADAGTVSNKLYIANSGDNTGTAGLLIYGDFAAGNVGIGTTSPVHKLQVAGTIGAQEIIVSSTGADYVFDPAYHLQPLDEVKEYVAANQHLPDIPSAAEVAQKGVSLGEMQSKLLAKIEELTLHLIEEKERNDKLEQRLAAIESGLLR